MTVSTTGKSSNSTTARTICPSRCTVARHVTVLCVLTEVLHIDVSVWLSLIKCYKFNLFMFTV